MKLLVIPGDSASVSRETRGDLAGLTTRPALDFSAVPSDRETADSATADQPSVAAYTVDQLRAMIDGWEYVRRGRGPDPYDVTDFLDYVESRAADDGSEG